MSESQAIGTPMARRIAFSTSAILTIESGPPKGLDNSRSRRRVVICSHFATDRRGSPPSLARSLAWVGASRKILEMGTTMTSLVLSSGLIGHANTINMGAERVRRGQLAGGQLDGPPIARYPDEYKQSHSHTGSVPGRSARFGLDCGCRDET